MKLSKHLPNLAIFPVMPKKSGIYFLTLGDEVVYVGKAIDIFLRLAAHRKSKIYDGFAFLEFPIEELDQQEAIFIHKFLPKHNLSIPAFSGIMSLNEIRRRLLSVIPNCVCGSYTVEKIMAAAGFSKLGFATSIQYNSSEVLSAFTPAVMEKLRLRAGARVKPKVLFPSE